MCENNGLAVNSPLSARHGNACLAGFAGVYGFPGHVIDGTDLDAVLEVTRQAVATARRGDGPSLIECRVKRWHGHVGPETDVDRGWQRADELAAWRADCPVRKFRQGLLAQNLADEPTLAAAEAAVDESLRADLAWAREQASPEPADIAQYLFKGAD